MSSRSRILIVDNSIAMTGALASALRSSKVLKEEFEFLFMLPADSQALVAIASEGFEVIELPMRELRRSVSSWILYLPTLFVNSLRFRAQLQHHRIDLVLANDFYNLLPAMSRLNGGGKPYVVYIRFMPDRFPKALVRMWLAIHYRLSEKVIAVSRAVEQKLLPHEKLTVIHNELPLEEISYKEPANDRLLFLSNFIQGKGQELALKSFARLVNKLPGWTLRFVGGDMGLSKNIAFKNYLQTLAGELGIGSRVEWAGYASDVGSEYLAAGIVLNLSDSESFSMTCLEAMYYGRCVVATRSGGPEEIVHDGVTGILVPRGDLDRLTIELERVMSDLQLRTELGRNAYHESRKRFRLDNTTGKLERVYLECIERIKG